MKTTRLKIFPRFIAGTVVDDALYYSACDFNGLMMMDLKTGIINYLEMFEQEPPLKQKIHKKSLYYNNKLFFIPYNSTRLHIYDLKTKIQSYIEVVDDIKSGGISDAHIHYGKLYLFPLKSKQCAKILDLQSGELYPNDAFNDWFQKTCPTVPSQIITRVAYIESKFYFAYNGGDSYFVYEPHNNEIIEQNAEEEMVFAIFPTSDGLLTYSRVYRSLTFLSESYVKKVSLSENGAMDGRFSNFPVLGNQLYALPFDAYDILHINTDGTISHLPYPDEYQDILKLNSGVVKFFGYAIYKDKLLVFPCGHDHMLCIENDSVKCIPTVYEYEYYDENEPFMKVVEARRKWLVYDSDTSTENKLFDLDSLLLELTRNPS